MMRKFYSRLIVVFALMLVGITGAWAQQRTQELLPRVVDFELQPGKMYIVQPAQGETEVILNAQEAGKLNGLRVAAKRSGLAPILYIPKDVTLTVRGANANGRIGAGAGIYVPSGAELIITGEGTLVATGGAAADGGNGENGHNPKDVPYGTTGVDDFAYWVDVLHESGNMEYSGRGGNGGYGGGGAGAGIGGIGGNGGVGGNGGAAVYFVTPGQTQSTQKDGLNGGNGGNGSNGAAMGKVSIMGTVTVTATAGAAANQGGTGGQQGYSFWHRTSGTLFATAHNIAGGGGGGAGGGAGYGAAKAIGGGGAGAGAGGGGGSGAVDWRETLAQTISGTDNISCRASSGKGGAGNIPGTATTDRPRDIGADGRYFQKQGGQGGTAGTAGVAGANGIIYIGEHVTMGETTHEESTGSAPGDMTINLTFVNNEFNEDGTQVDSKLTIETLEATIGEPLPDAVASTFQLSATSKYFAGYYTNDKGLGDRMYKGTGTTNLDVNATAVPFCADTELYAHFSHNQHRVNWDYSYDNNGILTDITTEKIKFGKLIFHFRGYEDEAWILDASSATNFVVPSGDDDYPLKGHTIATGKITLNGNGEKAEKTATWTSTSGNDGAFTIQLADEKLSQFISYEFVPMTSTSAQAPATWIKTTNADGHVTTFSFIGNTPENCFPLQWAVTLENLAMYPDVIYAQPLYKNGEDWPVISQTIHTLGVECAMTPVVGEPQFGQGSSRTYTFSYPVWKQDNQETPQDYQYRLGLTGFRLHGQTYFLNTPHETPHEHYVSPEGTSESNIVTWTKYNADHNTKVTMTLGRADIPVLRLDVNDNADPKHPATLDNGQPELIVTTFGGTIAAPNTAYTASRPGYKFMGWADHENGTIDDDHNYSAELSNYTETRTIYAVWEENVAPVITTQGITYNDNNAVVTLQVTDNVPEGVTVKYIISETEITDFDTKKETAEFWSNAETATLREGSTDLYDIELNLPRVYLYVMAEDAAHNKSYAASGEIVTDRKDPVVTIYPTGNVCNFPVTITATDNYQVQTIQIKKNNGDWQTVYTYSEGEKTKYVYTEPKLASDYSGEEPVVLSVKVTDASGNYTQIDNFTTMYIDHDWETTPSGKGIHVDEHGNYNTIEYYNCNHNCGHIWVKEIIGAEPTDPTNGYKHDSEKTGDAKTHQEQGLMREETNNFIAESASALIKNDQNTAVGMANGINNAITVINGLPSTVKSESKEYTVILVDDTNIGYDDENKTPTSDATIATPADGAKVTIDLNASGLLVDGNPADGQAGHAASITGNANVTILLTDNGNLDYANLSIVTGSPIKYVRDFEACTKSRKGNWQALYLPFDAAISDFEGYTVGKPKSVEITASEAKLSINKTVSNEDLVAFKHLFVKSSDGKVVITKTTELKPYAEPTETQLGDSKYYFKGSLTNSDNVAAVDAEHYFKTYWVLTNGGAFNWAKAGTKQRPYHWVIYDKDIPKTPAEGARPMTIEEVEDDPTAIRDITVDEAEQAEAAIYSLSGQRMPAGATLPSGIYVRNGKKIYVK